MAYTVLARKYRSWTFDALVGQEAVAATLKNAITSGRIHHGYLFTGTRGVGKTSAARILARSLNCHTSDGPTVTPCCKCESCTAIAEGQDIDVIEIDAASNTGVDNIRELRSNANYRPARSRFKIYIIDEVHMLSTSAFNALLKTLEEPPEHVKFIFATTEPHKVPATIHSRCLRFDFRNISADRIAGHFRDILKQEGIEADDAVLRRVARLGNGSMRDGLSLLDQLLSSGATHLTVEMIDDILPAPHDETLTRLLMQITDRDPAGALATLDECLSAGYSLEQMAESLGEQVRACMLLRVCGADTTLVEASGAVREELAALAKRLEPEACVYMLALLEELRRNVRYSSLARALAEAAVVRMASAVPYASLQQVIDQLGTGGDDSKKKVAPAQAAAPPPAPRLAVAAAARQGGGDRPAARPVRPASGGQSPSAAPPAPPRPQPPRNVSGEEMKRATSDPLVREAMDLFNGTLVNVEKID